MTNSPMPKQSDDEPLCDHPFTKKDGRCMSCGRLAVYEHKKSSKTPDDVERTAMGIVHYMGDLLDASVAQRQNTNDVAIDYVMHLIQRYLPSAVPSDKTRSTGKDELRELVKTELLSLAYSSAQKGPDWSQDGVGLPALDTLEEIMDLFHRYAQKMVLAELKELPEKAKQLIETEYPDGLNTDMTGHGAWDIVGFVTGDRIAAIEEEIE